MPAPTILSIGTFDGVHLGHRAIVRAARRLAQPHDAEVVMLAFDPHPAKTLRPGAEPPRLTTRAEKMRRLEAAGADRVVLLEPTREFLSQTPEAFIESLASEYNPVAFIEGPDFRFGKGRKGDMALLRSLGGKLGFEVREQATVDVALSNYFTVPVSSSAVRWLVAHGRMLDAAICLGEPYTLSAPVVTGEKRGRDIGVPTINLDNAALSEHLVPPDGVYAGTVRIGDREEVPYTAALSIGAKPTFGESPVAIEAHLLDFDGDLYGQTVTVRFARWLRAQCWFPDVEALKDQLQRDIAHTRWCMRTGLLDPPHRQCLLPRRAG